MSFPKQRAMIYYLTNIKKEWLKCQQMLTGGVDHLQVFNNCFFNDNLMGCV